MNLLFASVDLPLGALYVNEIRQYIVFLYLASSPYHNFLEVHPRCSMYQ